MKTTKSQADLRMLTSDRVLGPPNIANLMKNLEKNSFIRHFLLGNNVIGPFGARVIADFVNGRRHIIETWYLAGNCINFTGIECLVTAWKKSSVITSIWLKRNPLGPKAGVVLGQLVRYIP